MVQVGGKLETSGYCGHRRKIADKDEVRGKTKGLVDNRDRGAEDATMESTEKRCER